MKAPIDSGNRFLVGVKGDHICILNPPTTMPITRLQALNLAAWIVCLADPKREQFDQLVEEIQK
jgi:hypothetical protein